MGETVAAFTLEIEISDSRHSGGYDLGLQFGSEPWAKISADFNAGDTLKLDYAFSALDFDSFLSTVRRASVYSNQADTWRCKHVSIWGKTSQHRCFRWSTETSTEARNSKHAGANDHPLVFDGFAPNFGDAAFWMRNNLNVLGPRTLQKISMPGAHDAGMYTLTNGTVGACECNTLTQETSIYDMLNNGIRYFDIRPVISAKQFYTGHYSHVNSVLGYQGGNGDSIDSIVDQINRFTKMANELIVLMVSHDYNTDVGSNKYRPFNQEEADRLYQKLSGLNFRYTANPASPGDGNPDLTAITLQDYLRDGRPAVVLVFDLGNSEVTIPKPYRGNGFYYKPTSFPVIDQYTGTHKVPTMIADQIAKMKDNSGSYFLLSWTMTQSNAEAGGCCFVPGYASIRQLAKEANAKLDENLQGNCTSTVYPNIIYTDRIVDSTTAMYAMRLNSYVIGR